MLRLGFRITKAVRIRIGGKLLSGKRRSIRTVRVQAVIDGQCIALNDALVEAKMDRGRLFRLSPHQIDDSGYFLVHGVDAMSNPDVAAFAHWMLSLEEPADQS